MTITDSRELAAKAADELERRGYHLLNLVARGSDPSDSAVCLLGALGAAYFGDPWLGYGDGHANYLALVREIANGVDAPHCGMTTETRMIYLNSHADHNRDPAAFLVNKLREYAAAP